MHYVTISAPGCDTCLCLPHFFFFGAICVVTENSETNFPGAVARTSAGISACPRKGLPRAHLRHPSSRHTGVCGRLVTHRGDRPSPALHREVEVSETVQGRVPCQR